MIRTLAILTSLALVSCVNPTKCNLAVNVGTKQCQLQAETLDCAQLAKDDILTTQNARTIWNAIIGNGQNFVADIEVVAEVIDVGGWDFATCEIQAIKSVYGAQAKVLATVGGASAQLAETNRVLARIEVALQAHPSRQALHVEKMPTFGKK